MLHPYKVVVEASHNHAQLLDFHDAFQQISDFFSILKGKNDDLVLLDIKEIRRSNPLTVECTPYNVVTQDIDYTLVDPNARAFQQFYEAISTGADWDPDLPMFLHDPTKKILHRNTNGIGRTIFTLPYNDRLHEIEVLPQTAKLGLKVLNSSRKAPLSGSGSEKHIELGSIKGTIVALGKHYGKPAMKIQASSLGKQVWCCLSDEQHSKWESEITAYYAWNGLSVRIHGEIMYGENGKVQKIVNGRLEMLSESNVTLEDIIDPDFTGGLSPREYLDRLHAGDY